MISQTTNGAFRTARRKTRAINRLSSSVRRYRTRRQKVSHSRSQSRLGTKMRKRKSKTRIAVSRRRSRVLYVMQATAKMRTRACLMANLQSKILYFD